MRLSERLDQVRGIQSGIEKDTVCSTKDNLSQAPWWGMFLSPSDDSSGGKPVHLILENGLPIHTGKECDKCYASWLYPFSYLLIKEKWSMLKEMKWKIPVTAAMAQSLWNITLFLFRQVMSHRERLLFWIVRYCVDYFVLRFSLTVNSLCRQDDGHAE